MNSSVENCGAKVSHFICYLKFLLSSLELSRVYYAFDHPYSKTIRRSLPTIQQTVASVSITAKVTHSRY